MEKWQKGGFLEAFSDSVRIQEALDQGLQEAREKDAWLEAYRQRADSLDKLFVKNQAAASSLQETLQEPLTAEAADFLYAKLLRRKKGQEPGGRGVIPILLLLIPYYEKHEDVERLIQLYSYVYSAISTVGVRTQENSPLSKAEYSRKIIALKDKYTAIRDASARMEIFMAYYNICVEERAEGLIDANQSYRYLKEMLELWNSSPVQRLDGANEHIGWYITLTKNDWLAVESEIDGAGDEAKAFFCRLAKACYEGETSAINSPDAFSYFTVAAYHHAQAMEGTIPWDEALDALFSYYCRYLEMSAQADEEEPDRASFLLDMPPILERWLHHCTDEKLRRRVISHLKEDTRTLLYESFHASSDPAVISALTHWAATMLPYFDDREEKEEWLYNLVVRKQLATYLHAGMVEQLAKAITTHLLREQPQLFDPLRPLIQGQDMLEYLSKCAMFHDIGKNEIADVINAQVRSLEADEFAAIRKHPEYGCAILGGDAHLERYHDVILGHHKFYNGKGGYPEAFDNTASPYRFAIDLITICDCIDSATDSLGRNYKRAKTIDQVLAELDRDKGVRYNPHIVDCLTASPALQEELRHLVVEERGHIAYEIYNENQPG